MINVKFGARVAACGFLFGKTLAAAALTLPVADVKEVRDASAKTYPARVVSVAEVDVRPQVTGEILKVGFANGQAVAKGDVLYQLDPVQYRAAVKNAEAKVAELKANLAYAEKNAVRHEDLIKTRAVSQDALESALSTRDATRASLAAAEASLEAARDDLRHCTITAPIAGRVGSTTRTEGNYVQKGDARLVTLVQTDPVRVRFCVSNADYAAFFGSSVEAICRDARVGVRLVAGGAVCATGRVEYVENVADTLTDTVAVHALIANPRGSLLGGQTVMATLKNAGGASRAAVPPNAIAQDIIGTYVWVLGKDGRARKRRVTRGALQDGLQLVKEGLAPGERIVADGVHRVAEGMEVVAERP